MYPSEQCDSCDDTQQAPIPHVIPNCVGERCPEVMGTRCIRYDGVAIVSIGVEAGNTLNDILLFLAESTNQVPNPTDWNATTGPTQLINKPTNVSSFINDAGYITVADIPVFPVIPVIPTLVSAFVNDAGYLTSFPAPVAQEDSDWESVVSPTRIINKPLIPIVPTNVSDFTNDAGYVTVLTQKVPSLQDVVLVNKVADRVTFYHEFFHQGVFTPSSSYYVAYAKGVDSFYVYGSFTGYDGVSAKHVVKIRNDGYIDSTFIPIQTSNNLVYLSFAILEELGTKKLLMTGWFTNINGVSLPRIARFNTDGSVDSTFNVGSAFNDYTTGICYDVTNTKIYVGGRYSSFNGVSALRIARLNVDGSLDTSFVTGSGFTNATLTMLPATDGGVYVTTYSATYNGVSSPGLVKIGPTGIRDANFNIGSGIFPVGSFNEVTRATDGKIYLHGRVTKYNNITVGYITKLNLDGSIDATFLSGTGFNNVVDRLSLDANGRLIVIGPFTSYNGLTSYKGTTISGTIILNTDGTIYNVPPSAADNSIGQFMQFLEQLTNGSYIGFIDGKFTLLNNQFVGQSTKELTFDETTGIAEYNLEHYEQAGPYELLNKKTTQYYINDRLKELTVIGEAPADGKQYARKNTAWVEVIQATVPTVVSAFTNDANYITLASVPTVVSAFTNDSGYITLTSIANKVDKVAGERLINAAEIIKLSNQSGVNTGDQDLTGLFHANRAFLDLVSGTNTGDQDISVKENISNKQNSLAVDGTGIKYATVDAVNAGITNSIYWTKTTDNIQNNNIGHVQVKLLAAKQFQTYNSAGTLVAYIDEIGIGRYGAGTTYTSFGPASANIHLAMVRSQANADFTIGNPQITQPYSIRSSNYFGTNYWAGSSETSASALAEHSFNIGNVIGDGITSGIFRISRTRLQSKVPMKYATDVSTSYDDRTLVDKFYVDNKPLKNDVATASLTNEGKQRYYVSGNNSYTDIVMQTGVGIYAWVNIKTNTW
jgi:hypothetical protein